jgi:hypothetical protein
MSVTNTVTIAAKDLKVDHRVQRGIEETQVRHLMTNWNAEFVSAIVVSRRTDGYYVIDGLQRMTAITRLGQPNFKFTAITHNGLSLQDEAQLFLAHNQGRKAVSTYARYRVSVTAGDPVGMAVDEVVEALGLHVAATSSELGLGIAGALVRVVGKMASDIDEGKEILRRSLTLLWNTYGTTDWAWKAELVEGAALFFKRYPEASEAVLEKKLANKVTAVQLLTTARARAANNNRVYAQVADVLVDIHDKGKQQGRLRSVA